MSSSGGDNKVHTWLTHLRETKERNAFTCLQGVSIYVCRWVAEVAISYLKLSYFNSLFAQCWSSSRSKTLISSAYTADSVGLLHGAMMKCLKAILIYLLKLSVIGFLLCPLISLFDSSVKIEVRDLS